MKNIYRFILKILIWAHNFSYRLIGIFAIKFNGDIHPKHKILNYYDFFINNISPNDKILDIGCGNGACTKAISKKASNVIGIDISKKNIELARGKFFNSNLTYIIGDATKHNFKEKFDAIILSNTLEHIEDRTSFLLNISKLAPKILIRVPLLTRDWLSVYKKEEGFEYRLDKTHYIEYTEKSFEKEMQISNLAIENYYIRFGELYAIIKIKNVVT